MHKPTKPVVSKVPPKVRDEREYVRSRTDFAPLKIMNHDHGLDYFGARVIDYDIENLRPIPVLAPQPPPPPIQLPDQKFHGINYEKMLNLHPSSRLLSYDPTPPGPAGTKPMSFLTSLWIEVYPVVTKTNLANEAYLRLQAKLSKERDIWIYLLDLRAYRPPNGVYQSTRLPYPDKAPFELVITGPNRPTLNMFDRQPYQPSKGYPFEEIYGRIPFASLWPHPLWPGALVGFETENRNECLLVYRPTDNYTPSSQEGNSEPYLTVNRFRAVGIDSCLAEVIKHYESKSRGDKKPGPADPDSTPE